MGYRYSPPTHPPYPLPGYTPPAPGVALAVADPSYLEYNMVVGLISVEQLSLSPGFSDLRLMTEVYNLVEIGNR